MSPDRSSRCACALLFAVLVEEGPTLLKALQDTGRTFRPRSCASRTCKADHRAGWLSRAHHRETESQQGLCWRDVLRLPSVRSDLSLCV